MSANDRFYLTALIMMFGFSFVAGVLGFIYGREPKIMDAFVLWVIFSSLCGIVPMVAAFAGYYVAAFIGRLLS